MNGPVYRRSGGLFVPTDAARSPWSADAQHGGPANGLLARCAEQALGETSLRAARLTVDLFRAVPFRPLEVRTELVRRGRRIAVVQASLLAEGRECARATALFLAGDGGVADRNGASPDPPRSPIDGLEVAPLVPREMMGWVSSGFHMEVEVAWDRRGAPPRVWMRIPEPLVQGEETTPFQRVAAASDLASPLGGGAHGENPEARVRFINTDTTLYLERPPEGQWLGFQHVHAHSGAALAVCEVALSDAHGSFGRATQASLARR